MTGLLQDPMLNELPFLAQDAVDARFRGEVAPRFIGEARDDLLCPCGKRA